MAPVKRLKEAPTPAQIERINAVGLEAAAAEMGVSAATLWRWLKAHGYTGKMSWTRRAIDELLEAEMEHA